jgi:Replication-relaxation
MLPTLTKSQKIIIEKLIYRFRYLSRIHIQKLLFHKSPSRINSWLASLTDSLYLNRIYSPAIGENIKPSIYYIGQNGIRLMKRLDPENKLYIQNLYYDSKRSKMFQSHCLTLADFACNLFSYAGGQDEKATLLTKADFPRNDTTDTYDIFKLLKPDGFYTYSGTGIAKAGFIEIIDDITPAFALRKKIHRYIQASQELDWEQLSPNKFPSVIFILPNEEKMESLKRAIKRVRKEIDDEEISQVLRCNLTLASKIQTQSIASSIWQKS